MAFNIKFDTLAVQSLADSLAKFDAKTLGNASLIAVNAVTERAYELSVENMIAGINLTEDYVRSKTSVTLATNPNNIQAKISAAHGGINPSTLTSYGATVVTAAVKNFARSKGNAKIGVAKGMKAIGFDVSVSKGEPEFFSRSNSGNTYSFIIRAPNGVLLTVSRGKNARGKGSLHALYGPSVWQLFNATVPKMRKNIEADLENTVIAEVNKSLEKLL